MEETGCVPGADTDYCEENKISLAPTPAAIRIPDRPAHNLVTIPTTQSLLATNNFLGTLFANKKYRLYVKCLFYASRALLAVTKRGEN